MKLHTTSALSNDILFEKKNVTIKMKLYTTGKFISNDNSFEKSKKIISLQK